MNKSVNETSFAGFFRKLKSKAIWPTHGTEFAGAFDLYALNDGIIKSQADEATIFETGIGLVIPQGHAVQFWGRSSRGRSNIIVTGGFIDYDYRGRIGEKEIFGELKVMLASVRYSPYEVKAGEKIAQMVFVPCLMPGHNLEGDRGWNGTTGN